MLLDFRSQKISFPGIDEKHTQYDIEIPIDGLFRENLFTF